MTANELEPRLFLESDINAALELNNLNAPAVGEIDRTQLEFLIEHFPIVVVRSLRELLEKHIYKRIVKILILLLFCTSLAPLSSK